MWWLAGAALAAVLFVLSKMFLPNLVIITSVVHTSSKPLSYAQRSALSHEERFQQTLESIASVAKRVPNPYIVLVEGSALEPSERDALLSAGCNEIIDCSKDLREHINGIHKSPAEARMLLYALERIDPGRFATISKLSGRYYLTDGFSWHRHPLRKALYQCERPDRCNTRYYRIPSYYFGVYKETLEGALADEAFLTGGSDIEGYNIFRGFPLQRRLMMGVEKLGVKGYVAPWKMVVEDFSCARNNTIR